MPGIILVALPAQRQVLHVLLIPINLCHEPISGSTATRRVIDGGEYVESRWSVLRYRSIIIQRALVRRLELVLEAQLALLPVDIAGDARVESAAQGAEKFASTRFRCLSRLLIGKGEVLVVGSVHWGPVLPFDLPNLTILFLVT